ncbi:MAG: OmpA family protein, partial [Flavobacterium sp.]|nr:OmpA family protein [Candidatus Neoflavobacterium equi]
LLSNLILFGYLCNAQGSMDYKTASNEPIKTSGRAGKAAVGFLDMNAQGTSVNSDKNEVGVTFFKDKFIILSNKKRGYAKVTKNEITKDNNYNVFCTDRHNDNNLDRAVIFSRLLDSKNNEGGMAFSKDEKTTYVTHSKDSKSNELYLYKSKLTDDVKGIWSTPEEVTWNGAHLNAQTPYVSKDGKKLYFASNLAGGYGGLDLYVADLNNDGNLSNVTNLGSVINSAYDEVHPFIENEKLYFSSNDPEGFGGYDIYRVSGINSTPVHKINLGNKLNSEKDEIAFIKTDSSNGYYSSNKNDKNDGNYNIYRFKVINESVELTNKIVDANTQAALSNTDVTVIDESGKVVFQGKTDNQGIAKFNADPLSEYTVVTKHDNYKDKTTTYETTNSNPTATNTIFMDRIGFGKGYEAVDDLNEKLNMNKVHFDFDKYNLTPDNKNHVAEVKDILERYPNLKLNIQAHTDNRGSEAYNLKLSEKRASCVYQYLLSEGIPSNKLQTQALGESKPIVPCTDNCSETDHSKNRRVEFKIVEK